MRRMAIGAHCRNHQAALQQPFTMNAHDIVLHDFMLLPGIADRRLVAFFMTSSAEVGNVSWVCRRFRATVFSGVVNAVAILAGRRIGIAAIGEGAVRAGQIDFDDLGVTNGTVNFGCDCGAGPMSGRAGSGMALGAGRLPVIRAFNFKRIDIQR